MNLPLSLFFFGLFRSVYSFFSQIERESRFCVHIFVLRQTEAAYGTKVVVRLLVSQNLGLHLFDCSFATDKPSPDLLNSAFVL